MTADTTNLSATLAPPTSASSPWRAWGISLLIAAVFYVAVAPTLILVQLHDPIENLNIATAMEMRHGGPWIVPNLQGIPRLAKPPLTAWLTALSIRPSTIAALDTTEPAARTVAYDRLMYESRRPAALAAAVMLIAVFWLGYFCGGEPVGVFAACICATEWLFLRHARLATTDIQLAMWVAVTNAFLAAAVLRQRVWLGAIGGGISLGLVMMAKGPVGLLQTILPFLIFIVVARWAWPSRPRTPWRKCIAPAIVSTLLMLVIGGWWFVWVVLHNAHMGQYWFIEVAGGDDVPPGHWYNHFLSLYLMLPWLVWLVAGIAIAVIAIARRTIAEPVSAEQSPSQPAPGRIAAVLGLLMLFVPIILMSFNKDRFQRYLVPMCPAAALIAAGALFEFGKHRAKAAWLMGAHWAIIGIIAVGLPVLMAVGKVKAYRTAEGLPVLGMKAAVLLVAAGLMLTGIGVAMRRRPYAGVVMAMLIMLLSQATYYYGLGETPGGQCELKTVADRIIATYPNAQIYDLKAPRLNIISVYGNELSIYLNRPVHFAHAMDEIAPTAEPQLLVMVVSKRAAMLPTPPGWTRMAYSKDANAKYVFLRLPPASQ